VELAGSHDRVHWFPRWSSLEAHGRGRKICGAHLGPEAERAQGHGGACSAPTGHGGDIGGGRGVWGAYGGGTAGWWQHRVEATAVWERRWGTI
jgi:hypothetical protein